MLLWLVVLAASGLLLGPPLGLVAVYALSGDVHWIAVLVVIATLVALGGRILYRADRREQAGR